ncbi:MAG: NTP transferase domain-containing protein, partial [Pseudomonadota bacterium]
MIVTFIPAAGASSRLRGTDKLLYPLGGHPILRRTATEAVASDLGPVVVGLRSDDR